MNCQPQLFNQIRDKASQKKYSTHTEQAYTDWIKRFILFHGERHPENMGVTDIKAFLNHLALEKNMAASTHNQALNALLFLYKEVLGCKLASLDNIDRVKPPARLPVVLTNVEIQALLARLEGRHWLMASLLYGAGLRLMECVRLRVKDVKLNRCEIIVRDSKGGRDRVTMLPDSMIFHLKTHLEKMKVLHSQDLAEGFGDVYLPAALAKKHPNVSKKWSWQYVFPATKRSLDPHSGSEKLHHIDEQSLQRVVKQAMRAVGIHQSATCHTLRHSFAIHLLQSGYDICTVQKLLGHKNVSSTMIYIQALNKDSITLTE